MIFKSPTYISVGRANLYYPSINIFISSATLVIPPIPKFSTNTLTTFGERKAGNVGPKWIFFTPKYSKANNTITAFVRTKLYCMQLVVH